MPTYDYICEDCGYEFSKFQKMSEDHLKVCPKCNKETLKRKIGTGAGIIFKGSGFYCTDYAHKNASPTTPSPSHEHGCGCECCKHNH